MKKVKLFILRNCPYCIQALDWQAQLMREHPEFQDIDIETIDESEQSALANSYDYYYVPTYYVDEKKLHEGVATKKKIENVLLAAME